MATLPNARELPGRKQEAILSVAGAALMAFGASSAAAQDVSPPQSATLMTDQQQTGVAGAAGQDAVEAAPAQSTADAGDIIVTARRRSEFLQDVPQSIAAFSGDTLRNSGVTSVNNLERIAPSLHASPKAGKRDVTTLELRGIGTTDVIYSLDPTVGVYVNEVPMQRPWGFQAGMVDVENVQVLYGPQGTLFGRNTTGGAILVSTVKPSVDSFSGEAAVRLGNYHRNDYEGIINIPLASNAAIRLVGKSANRRGYTRDVLTGKRLDDENYDYWRASFQWRPVEGVETLLVYDGFHSSTNGSGTQILATRAPGTPDPAYLAELGVVVPSGPTAARYPLLLAAIAQQQALGPRKVRSGLDLFAKTQTHNVTNTTTWEISDALSIKNVIGWRKVWYNTFSDFDGSSLAFLASNSLNRGTQFSEEFQLQGKVFDDKLSYTAGLFYFREHGRDTSLSYNFTAFGNQLQDSDIINKSKSVYAQATYAVTDKLNFTAGGRYTWDDRFVEVRNSNPVTGACLTTVDAANSVPANPCRVPASVSFSKPTYNVSFDYKPSNDILFYAAHRQGYRSGGISERGGTLAARIPFRPELVRDVELGTKSTFSLGDVRVRTNLAVYNTWYNDVQRSVARLSPLSAAPLIITSIINAAKATVRGGEFNLGISPTREFTLQGSLGIADAKYDKFNVVIPGNALTRKNEATSVSDVDFLNFQTTWSIGANYDKRLSHDGESVFGNIAYAHHSSGNYTNDEVPFSNPEGLIPASGELNASIGWSNIKGSNLSLRLFGENITNNDNLVYTFSLEQQVGFTSGQYNAPAMYGVEARIRF